MDKQKLFDRAAAAIIRQGKPSMARSKDPTNGQPRCAYNGVGGVHCAIGHLVPATKRAELLKEHRSIRYNLWRGIPGTALRKLLGFKGTEGQREELFLIDLQREHDSASSQPSDLFVSKFKEGMHKVAGRYGLSTEVLNG